MRHGCKVNHLSRTHAHRVAMLSNMATSLIMHKRIETTVAKAKALRVYVEPIINRSKEDTTHNRRIVKVANRPGGYTRILKTGIRHGDNSEMAIIELVDYNENMLREPKKAKTTRRSRAKKAEAAPAAEAPVAEAPVVDTPAAEAEAPKAE